MFIDAAFKKGYTKQTSEKSLDECIDNFISILHHSHGNKINSNRDTE